MTGKSAGMETMKEDFSAQTGHSAFGLRGFPMAREPSTTSTETRLVGQEGHDTTSCWERLCDKYCDFIVDDIRRHCGNWGDLGLDAFEDAIARIRRKGGLFIRDYRKRKFRRALIRLSRQTLRVLGMRRDTARARERLVATGLQLLRQPSRSPDLSDEQIALQGIRLRICRELLSGHYKDTDLAGRFSPADDRKIILWRHAALKKLNREDDGSAADELGARPWTVTRARQDINAKIDLIAAEELVRRF